MGKNHKHQKRLKAEKSKVKLRVKGEKTKFLPKGQNVTDTTFKIKPITLPNQLQAKTNDEPLSKRKLNAKELIQRLKHHNVNVKLESGEELCLIINEYPDEILGKYLSQLLQSSCQLILDKERKVRKMCIKLLEVILKNMPTIKIEPFYAIISSFLRCSMTNINISIQEDSLMILDVLLMHVPSLVAKDSEKLLANFLTLISTLRADAKPGRTLTVNLGSKLTTVKWKIKVLHRLRGILKCVVDHEFDVNEEKNANEIVFKKINTSHCPLYKRVKYSETSELLKSDDDSGNESVVKQIKSLISLLYESWLEVAPELKKHVEKHEFTNLNTDAVAILNCSLNILSLLNNYVEKLENRAGIQSLKREITKGIYTKFINILLEHYPYSLINQGQSSKKNDIEKILDVQTDPKCLQENLLIAFAYCSNNNSLGNLKSSDEMGKILSYVNMCLKNRNYVSSEKINYLVAVLNVLLTSNNPLINHEELLENIISFYNSSYITRTSKLEIFHVLAGIINNPNLMQSIKYQIWLSTLPTLLCQKEIHLNLVDKLSLISKSGNNSFHSLFLKKLKDFLDNVLKINIIGKTENCNEELIRIKLLSMMTHSRELLCKKHIDLIKSFIDKCDNESYRDYLIFNFA